MNTRIRKLIATLRRNLAAYERMNRVREMHKWGSEGYESYQPTANKLCAKIMKLERRIIDALLEETKP